MFDSKRLPGLVVVGVPKSGTTSLHHWLSDHPEVAGPSVKETGYFVDTTSHAFQARANFNNQGPDGYGQFFPDSGDRSVKVVFETAPDYMYQKTAIDHLPDISTHPDIVFVLREPAAQIYSLFQYCRNNWQYLPDSMTFGEFVKLAGEGSERLSKHEILQHAIDNARYVRNIERWTARCGEDRVRVYLFEDMKRDNVEFMKRFSADIGIDPGFYDSYEFDRENETYRVRSQLLQRLNLAVRSKLPGGRLYKALRSAYRQLNTSAGAAPMSEEDRDVLRSLRREYVNYNRALAERCHLDLAAWSD